MAGGNGYTANAEALERHSKFMAGDLADNLQQSVGASQVSLGADAMGILCQAWSFIFDDELEEAKHLVSQLPGIATAQGDGVKSNAENYRNVEEGNAGTFGGGA